MVKRELLASIHPFGLETAGGGAKIMRTLLSDAPIESYVINTAKESKNKRLTTNEIRVPFRPSFGRLERSRLAKLFMSVDSLFLPRFNQRLEKILLELKPTQIHSIAHHFDFIAARQIAKKIGARFHLTIHDDLEYLLRAHPLRNWAVEQLSIAWNEADSRMVISPEMGAEYARRYGAKPYHIVTDGAKFIAKSVNSSQTNRLRIFFFGLLHIGCYPNMEILLKALHKLKEEKPELEIELVTRCGMNLQLPISNLNFPFKILPFTLNEEQLSRELMDADLLYMPLHFAEQDQAFTKYSFSTKMISYLASGTAILFHGPVDSASGRLLQNHTAALMVTSLKVEDMIDTIRSATIPLRQTLAVNALELAKQKFQASRQRSEFWDCILNDPE